MTTPRHRIQAARTRLGAAELVRRCNALLRGGEADEDRDLIVALGGPAAVRWFADGAPAGTSYWVRVWAARGLLWAGPGDETTALRQAFSDEHWRVREMACKVVARHRVGDLLEVCSDLEADPVARVRTAASRAVVSIVAAGA